MTIDQLLTGGGLGAVVGVLTWWTTARSTKRAQTTDQLTQATKSWQDMADDLREEMKSLRADVDELRAEVRRLEAMNSTLGSENRTLRGALRDVERWMDEIDAWIAAGRIGPSPHTPAQIRERMEKIRAELTKETG